MTMPGDGLFDPTGPYHAEDEEEVISTTEEEADLDGFAELDDDAKEDEQHFAAEPGIEDEDDEIDEDLDDDNLELDLDE